MDTVIDLMIKEVIERNVSVKDLSVIIAAAGRSSRWNQNIAPKKHLAPLPDGRTLIQRTVDQLKEAGCRKIVVSTIHDSIEKAVCGADVVHPGTYDSLLDTIISSSASFSKRVVVLLGDVYFSYEALEEILECGDDIRFFGHKCVSQSENRPGERSEIYALSFSSAGRERVIHALIKSAGNAAMQRGRFRLLRAMRRLQNGSLAEHIRRVYPPWPPKALRKRGVSSGRIWQIFRIAAAQRKGASRYGKLWGLYLELTGAKYFYGEILCDLAQGAALFTQINDVTRDVDFEKDYVSLLNDLDAERNVSADQNRIHNMPYKYQPSAVPDSVR